MGRASRPRRQRVLHRASRLTSTAWRLGTLRRALRARRSDLLERVALAAGDQRHLCGDTHLFIGSDRRSVPARGGVVVRRLTATTVAATILVAVTGCLTPLRSQPPLAPVPVPASPLVGVYEPGGLGTWSGIAE